MFDKYNFIYLEVELMMSKANLAKDQTRCFEHNLTFVF